MSLTSFRVSYSNTPFTCTFLVLHIDHFLPTSLLLSLLLHYSPLFFSIPTIMSLMKLTTFPVLIKSYRISFIIIWNITEELISLENITVGSNNSSRVVNTVFHSCLFFIHTLLYHHLRSDLVNTFFVPIFSIISEIRGKG